MDIDELIYKEDLSQRAYNACKGNGLLDLADLKEYYKVHGSFLDLNNCGAKTNIELVEICVKHIALDESVVAKSPYANLSIVSVEELSKTHKYKRNGFSKRTLLVCKLNNLNTLQDILQHYDRFGSYTNLYRTGKNTTAELVSVFNEYSQKQEEYEGFERLKDLPLSDIENTTINNFIKTAISRLSVRSANALSNYLGGDFDYKNFNDLIFKKPHSDVSGMKNVGAKTFAEIQEFLALVRGYALEAVNMVGEEEKRLLKNRLILKHQFSPEKFYDDIFSSNAIFKIVDHLIKHYVVFEGNHGLVFQKGLSIYADEAPLSLESIADDIGLTRERVRQIRVEILETLFYKFAFVKELYDPFIEKLNLHDGSLIIWVDEELAKRINNEHNTRFSLEFLTCLFGAVMTDRYYVVGVLSDVLVKNESLSRRRHNWKRIYIVKREFADVIDFDGILDILNTKASQKINRTIRLDLNTFVKPYVALDKEHSFEDAVFLIEKIIRSEFEPKFVSVVGGFISLHKNTVKVAYEYAYEALEALGKASSVYIIADKAMEINPGYVTSGDQMRAAMKRARGFVPIGRSGKFGLKKWEKENESFKGGTIREIVTEFLDQYSEPVKMSKVVEFVLKYRPRTNAKSIFNNLSMDSNQKFVLYKNSKLGLSSKTYSPHFEIAPEREKRLKKAWDERYKDLTSFLQNHNRLPRSISVPKAEVSLYRWWNSQCNRLHNNDLSSINAERINAIIANTRVDGIYLSITDTHTAYGNQCSSAQQLDIFDDKDF